MEKEELISKLKAIFTSLEDGEEESAQDQLFNLIKTLEE